MALYQHDYLQGKAAITLNQYGEGKVVYIGTMGDHSLYSTITAWLIEEADVKPSHPTIIECVEVAERWQGETRFRFLFNHTDKKKVLELESRFNNLLNCSSPVEETITIEPNDLLILVQEQE